MTTFADAAFLFLNDRTDATQRRQAWSEFQAVGLPTTSDEVWRYAPLNELELDAFGVASTPSSTPESAFARELAAKAAIVIRVVDGFPVDVPDAISGVSVEAIDSGDSLGGDSLLERYESDSFALLNVALSPLTTRIRVASDAQLDGPIVVLSRSSAGASFPRTQIVVERGANATVVEYYEGGADALVVPLSEYLVEDNAALQLVTYQRLDATAWHIARSTGILSRDARLHQAIVGLGAHYDRSRSDAELRGVGASNELRTTYLGSGDQVHDFRTRQFHVAPRTTSTLLSKGAVADHSRSVYTGLIEIEKGAKRTDARQTNHNLLLSPTAHADSVPNLDIRENDVMCAHASSVGPLNELQRWYLESRGVSRADAQRLLIQGFFFEMLSTLPSEIAKLVESDIMSVLSSVTVVTP